MLTAAMTAISSVVRQIRFGDQEAVDKPVVEILRETKEQSESQDDRGCDTIKGCFESMGLHHLRDESYSTSAR